MLTPRFGPLTLPLTLAVPLYLLQDADIILAAECVWLQDLVAPFVTTVANLLSSPRRPQCILAFREPPKSSLDHRHSTPQPRAHSLLCPRPHHRARPRPGERATATSSTFSTASHVLDVFGQHGIEARWVALGDAPESEGLMTTFYELRCADAQPSSRSGAISSEQSLLSEIAPGPGEIASDGARVSARLSTSADTIGAALKL